MSGYVGRLALAIVALALIPCRPAVGMAIFSEGMTVPETISLAPSGSYFIPDAANDNIYVVPHNGGTPGIFATMPNPSATALGGLFLPNDLAWGTNAGKFATVGYVGQTGLIYIYDAGGTPSLFKEATDTTSYVTPMIAPGGFGSYGGNLLMTADGYRGLLAVTPGGDVNTIVRDLPIRPFGLAYAPTGFGAVGGKVLVSSGGSGEILAIADNGVTTPFQTDSLLGPGQTGLRQMAFSPDGFIAGYGSLLFVSVSGSNAGGGTLGDVVALDGSGNIVASLRTLGLSKFDPRGLLFDDLGDLLISDASDPILLATSADFEPSAVPEPSTLALVFCALAVLGLVRRRHLRTLGS